LVNEVGIEPVTIGQARDSDKGSIAVAIGSPLGLLIQYPQELYLISGRPMELT